MRQRDDRDNAEFEPFCGLTVVVFHEDGCRQIVMAVLR